MSEHHAGAGPVSAPAARAAALEALLVDKGIVATDVIDAVVDTFERDVGPQNGARVVARAWVDPDFKARLLADGTAAMAELGVGGVEGENIARRREHGRPAQRRRLHAVLVLPVARPRDPARLVQEPALPGPPGPRAAHRAGRDGPRAA